MSTTTCSRIIGNWGYRLSLGILWMGIVIGHHATCVANQLLERPSISSRQAHLSLMLDVVNTGGRLVAVGERGYVLRSEDNGESWLQGAVPVSVTLTAVHFSTPEAGWAVGHGGVILHTVDGGRTWVKQLDGHRANELDLELAITRVGEKELEMETATGERRETLALELEDLRFGLDDARSSKKEGAWKPFMDVWFRDEREGFAVGTYGMIFHTEDGGATWRAWRHRIPNPDGYHYNAITAVAGTLFIAGEAGTLYRSTDGGQRWEPLNSPHSGSFFGMVGGKTEDFVIVFGLRGKAFKSVDLGITWEPLPIPMKTSLSGGAILADGAVAIAATKVLVSRDAGGTFRPLAMKPSGYCAVSAAGDGHLVVVGMNGISKINMGGSTPEGAVSRGNK